MSEAADIPSLTVAELVRGVDAGAPFLLLDVRNADDFAAWRVEGRRAVETLNVPYFDFLEEEAAALARLPRDRAIVALCAKGGSSALVVELLRAAGLDARNVEGGMAAYGEYLEPVRVPPGRSGERFELWQVNRRGKGCLGYVVVAGGEALVIDPSRDVDWYARFTAARGARIVRVLDTHVHADHLSGGAALAAACGAPYSVGAGASAGMRQTVAPLADGARVGVGRVELEVLATPGHTPGSACFLLDGCTLFGGDTLFVSGIGRPDLGGEAFAWAIELHASLHGRLGALPDATRILPAHFAGAAEIGADGVVAGTLGELRRTPELAITDAADFAARVAGAVTPPPDVYAAIVRANLGELVPDCDQAAEWELGKNQCAASAARANP